MNRGSAPTLITAAAPTAATLTTATTVTTAATTTSTLSTLATASTGIGLAATTLSGDSSSDERRDEGNQCREMFPTALACTDSGADVYEAIAAFLMNEAATSTTSVTAAASLASAPRPSMPATALALPRQRHAPPPPSSTPVLELRVYDLPGWVDAALAEGAVRATPRSLAGYAQFRDPFGWLWAFRARTPDATS